MTDAASGLSILHVIVRAGPTNSQYNEHCLPVLDTRRITVCSLFPADVQPPDELNLFEGDGTVGGCFRALRRTLAAGEYDVVHVHAPASGILTLITYFRLHRSRRDLAFTVHNSWQSFRMRNRLFLRLILLLFPLVVVCGQAAYESMPRRLRSRHRKVQVVPNGVDVDRIDKVLDGQEVEARDGFHAVTVSRLIPIKHPHTVLSAFMSMRKASDTLVVVGDGTLRTQLDDRVQHEGLLRQVSLRGVIPRDDVYRELDRADAFLTTSAGEGLPVALLEAMACGLPVIASDIPPHREVARVAKGLPLVPVGDTEGFARALTRLKTAGPEERDIMGQRLRACVLEHFSVRSMNESYGRLYRAHVPRGAEVGRPLRSTHLDKQVGLLDRVKRRIAFILALSVLGAAVGFGVAFVQSPVFKGETSVQVGKDIGVAANEETLKTSAALAIRYADLTRREPVLGPLVDDGWAETWRDLQRDVFARVSDKNPQLIEISVYTDARESSAQLAAAVAASLLRTARSAIESDEQFFLRQQVNALEDDITAAEREAQRVRDRLVTASAEVAPALRGRLVQLQGSLAELRSSYVELDGRDTSEAGELGVVDEAWTTRSPLRPTPVVLGVVGLIIGLTLAIGWIHLFDRRPPAGGGTGEFDPATIPQQHPRNRNGHTRASAWAGQDASWRDHDLERR